jgi:hypothetical protein
MEDSEDEIIQENKRRKVLKRYKKVHDYLALE